MIGFDVEGVDWPELDLDKIGRWITAVAVDRDRTVGNINYLFCNDEYILEQNNKFLGHDYYTDVITFDYSLGRRIGGDVMISLDTVRSNAEKMGVACERELLRVIIHGVLHLCGIDDKGPGEREIMEQAENKALRMYFDQAC